MEKVNTRDISMMKKGKKKKKCSLTLQDITNATVAAVRLSCSSAARNYTVVQCKSAFFYTLSQLYDILNFAKTSTKPSKIKVEKPGKFVIV